ncbi:hypothetical protein ACQFYA_03750 [Promicromonospora sp. Marseille-Q5078]
MSTHDGRNHARDGWTDARTDETLRRELDALAGLGAASSGLDDGALGSVRRRVRRRRTVKQAGIGATTLAVAAGLVLGGAALMPDAPQPLPGPANSPTPTPTSSPSPSSPAAGSRAVDVIQPGHQPGWLEGTELRCGMPADDVPTPGSPAAGGGQGITIGAVGDDPHLGGPASDDAPATLRLATRTVVGENPPDDAVLIGPSLLWEQYGTVVDLGIDMTEDPVEVRPGDLDRTAEDSTLTTCAPDGVAEGTTAYATSLPDGEYRVATFEVVWSKDFTEHALVVGPWRHVRLDQDGATLLSPGSEAGASGDGACSAAGLDLPDHDWTELPGPVHDTARTMLDAALACDDEALIALAEASDRIDENWGGKSPRELFELPAAEEDEDVYAILARLLSGTRPCTMYGGQGLGGGTDEGVGWWAYGWPLMGPGGCPATADDWQAAVDAGAVTAHEAQVMQEPDSDGYEGWRFVISDTGAWQQLVDGYEGPPRG